MDLSARAADAECAAQGEDLRSHPVVGDRMLCYTFFMEKEKHGDSDEHMVLLARFVSLPEAQIVQGELESEGLRTFLQQDQWLGVGRRCDQQLFCGRLFVLRKDLAQAEALLGDRLPKDGRVERGVWQERQDDPRPFRSLLWGFLALMILVFLMLTLGGGA